MSSFGFRRGRSGADTALALLVVVVVGLMVVPLPTWLLDVLLASNLAASIALLLVTLYVRSALEVATFPSVLLIATLIRASLNVASTRLILLQADAGLVIRSFGEFVVRGDFVVGAVVFCILSIVQFVVVAKGSERVAEVGARFCLDALPGKQMAIEAEVRAGAVSVEQARHRGRLLERESHFYGAMDGAAKFVKGDVIASLLILVVNLVGGVSIGVLRGGLSFDAALHTYGVLTIGDGLVTQVPALLTATAAGILVTRVASDEKAPLGSELCAQLFAIPRAIGITGALIAGLGFVPGLPALPFVSIGGALGLLAFFRSRSDPLREGQSLDPSFEPCIVPWSLEVSSDLARVMSADALEELTEELRASVFRARGVPLPPASVGRDDRLPDRHAVLSLHEVPAMVVVVSGELSEANVEAALERRFSPLLTSRSADFLGVSETQALLARVDERAPGTVREVIPRIVDVSSLTDVLRRLLEESVSIRDMKGILDALARSPEAHRDPLSLTEHVRSELRRTLTWELTGGLPELSVVVLDSHIEDTVRAAVARTSAGSFLTLAPAAARDIVAAVRRAFEGAGDERRGVVLTRPDVRRFVRKLLEVDLPDVHVVSHAELLPELIVKTRARATIAGT